MTLIFNQISVQPTGLCAKEANDMAIKNSSAQTNLDKPISEDALQMMSLAARSLVEALLTDAAFEASSMGKTKVEVSDLDKVWPSLLLRY
ncbi:hypothetical protein Ddc_13687 [Ditylenchus destructor]|nr:hypothetical protein Ddc_13687 [Ditylenchus destructor]